MIEMVNLTDVCDFQGGTQPPKSTWIKHPKDGYIRMLQIRDFTQPEKNNIEYVPHKSNLKTCQDEDILIGRYGASIGKICTGLSGAYNVALIKVIPNKEGIESSFLLHLLKGGTFQHFIQNIGGRAAQAGFNKSDLEGFQFKLPPLDQQKKIAAILDAADAYRQKTKALIEKYDQLSQSLFLEMFGDPNINPKGWKVSPLSEVSMLTTKGSSPNWQGFGYLSEGVRFVTSENVRLGYLDVSKDKFVHPDFNEKLKRSQLKENDLLINLVGASIGRGALVSEAILPANINQAVAKTELDDSKVHPIFILHQIITPQLQARLIGNKVEGARANISLKNVRELLVFLPPLDLQELYVAKYSAVNNLKENAKATFQKSEDLFSSLLQKAFMGELNT